MASRFLSHSIVATAGVVVLLAGCPGPGHRPLGPAQPGAAAGDRGHSAALPTPAPAQGVVRLAWTSFYQEDVSRFEVYRAPAPTGPWTRVSGDDQLIQGKAFLNARTGDQPVDYEFVDDTLPIGRGAYYSIQKVDLLGRQSPYLRRPVYQKAVDPKTPPRDLAASRDPSKFVVAPPVDPEAPTNPVNPAAAPAEDAATSDTLEIAPSVPTFGFSNTLDDN